MAYLPEKWFCDFCTNELKPGQKRITIDVPLTSLERRELVEAVDRDMKNMPASVLGLPMLFAAPAPTHYTVMSCVPCISTILPNAIAIRKVKIAEHIEAIRTKRERARQLEAEEEEVG